MSERRKRRKTRDAKDRDRAHVDVPIGSSDERDPKEPDLPEERVRSGTGRDRLNVAVSSDEKNVSRRVPMVGSEREGSDPERTVAKRSGRRSEGGGHLKELEAAPQSDPRRARSEAANQDEQAERPEQRPAERAAPRSRPAPRPLEAIASGTSEPAEPSSGEEDAESGPTPARRLEERVARSVMPEDIERMRSLAEKVYYEGWTRLSTDEQLAFVYNSKFLSYLSDRDRTRPEVQRAIYRVIGAQGKSLGIDVRYRIAQLSTISERFFEKVLTPVNAPDLYRRVENTDYFIGNARK